jgi:hypothetical protein
VTHRVIISSKVSEALADSEVREQFTPAQCTKIDQIVNGTQPCADQDFRYLLRRLAQAYCQED